jgi:hypothetical protein
MILALSAAVGLGSVAGCAGVAHHEKTRASDSEPQPAAVANKEADEERPAQAAVPEAQKPRQGHGLMHGSGVWAWIGGVAMVVMMGAMFLL